VDVVAARDRERFEYEVAYVLAAQDALVPAMERTGVPVHCLGGTSSSDLRWTGALRRLLVDGRFDVLHSHLPYTAAFGRLVALSVPRGRRPAVVYTEHSLWDKAALLTKALNRATVGVDGALVVVSATARDALPPRLRARARVVVHGIDRTRFTALAAQRPAVRRQVRHELGVPDEAVVALTVANMRSEKGYDVLVEAARLSVAAGTPVRFVAVGRGPLEAELTAEVAAKGLGERIMLLGTRTDTARLMAAADMFVLPSHQEGLPVALMEAMSSGLPVVATMVGGVPDVVTDGVEGLLVQPGRPDLLAEAVGRVAGDDALRARLAAASAARSEIFDVGGAAREIEAVYGELLAPAPGRRPSAIGQASDGTPLVLHVIPTAAPRGAQREARALVTGLDVPGVRRHRLMSLFAGPDGVPVDVALGHDGGERPAVGFDPRLVLRLRAALRRLRPTVVVAHGGDPLKYLVPALAGWRLPLAYYATGTFEHAGRPARVALWRALVRRADVVACEGEEVLEQCRDLLGVPAGRSLLAPNGRDPVQFHPPEPHERHPGDGPPALVFVGALTTGKRPDEFVEVVAALRRGGTAVRAVVCGDGPLAPTLAGPAADAGVELLGSRPDVAEVLRRSDVFVFPSLPTGEGMPGVLIEAGLTALPVVATAVPGVRTVVEDGATGFVVDPGDRPAMVEAVARLVADGALRRRMGDAARVRCETRFSFEAVAACWWGFLAPLVERGTTGRPWRRGGRRRAARGDAARRVRPGRGRSGPDIRRARGA